MKRQGSAHRAAKDTSNGRASASQPGNGDGAGNGAGSRARARRPTPHAAPRLGRGPEGRPDTNNEHVNEELYVNSFFFFFNSN